MHSPRATMSGKLASPESPQRWAWRTCPQKSVPFCSISYLGPPVFGSGLERFWNANGANLGALPDESGTGPRLHTP